MPSTSETPRAETPHMAPKKRCLFDPRKLHAIANAAVGLPPEEAFAQIIAQIAAEYGPHIETRQAWVFNNAGGAMGQMTILHGSIREYVIIFGTCTGTTGHSGRYGSEVFDFVFDGEMLCEYEGRFEPEVHGPGSPAYLGSGVVKDYWIKDSSWMLEYARGFIPAMLPFGLADSFLSTLDFKTIGRTLRLYGKQVVRGLLRGKDLDLALLMGAGLAGLVALIVWLAS